MSNELINWFLVFTRTGAMLGTLPVFSSRTIPIKVRLALGAVLALMCAPLTSHVAIEAPSLWSLLRLVLMELSVGLLLGFVCRFLFFALEVGGGIIAAEMGLILPSEFNQFTGAGSMAPATILYWLGAMLLFSLDLHHWIIVGFQRSYGLVPIGGAHLREALALDVLARTRQVFTIALQISAPLMAVSFVVTLVFSVLSRAVPQMNVFQESIPVRTLLGLIAFGLTCTFMAQHIANYLRRLPEDMLSIARLVGG
ncbi:MAG: flagellar biosynthetic protein FliR [Verrucomicrobiales bacterium]|nr:flagellar biosynthetic protein FliR [Verrucomicrobiales bacterium]